MDIEPVILVGHVLDRLRDLPDNSVHEVVTSPPYWGLRDYGLPPIVWGGDRDCDHEWVELGRRYTGGKGGETRTINGTKAKNAQDQTKNASFGDTCANCGAWRGQLGLEPTPQMFVLHMVEIFREVRRVLRPDGTLWLNLGDCYATGAGSARDPGGRCRASSRGKFGKQQGVVDLKGFPETQPNRMPIKGLPAKNLVGIPWRVAFALQEDGWILRSDNIWQKPNAMPQSVNDRASTDHEYVFLFSKSGRYFWDREAVKSVAAGANSGRESKPKGSFKDKGEPLPGRLGIRAVVLQRNLRTVWPISSRKYKGAHFATFPPELPLKCIKAGSSERGCCSKCGRPWKRLTKRVRIPTRPGHKTKLSRDRQTGEYLPLNGKPWAAGEVGNRDPQRHITATETIGWEPSCKCDAGEPVPCIVLDPFAGTGTTLMMAKHLGRRSIGIEISEEYVPLARERIAAGYTAPKKKGARRRRHRSQGTQKEMF